MAYFQSSEQFHDITESLFDSVRLRNANAITTVNKSKLLLRINCTEPELIITINGRRVPAELIYGNNGIRPEVDVHLAADTLHQILLGKLSLAKALNTDQIKVKGRAHKTLAMANLFLECQKIYPRLLVEKGYNLEDYDLEIN